MSPEKSLPEDADDHLHDCVEDDCWQCGGEGFVYSCFDGMCINAEEGCEACAMRCDICNRSRP